MEVGIGIKFTNVWKPNKNAYISLINLSVKQNGIPQTSSVSERNSFLSLHRTMRNMPACVLIMHGWCDPHREERERSGGVRLFVREYHRFVRSSVKTEVTVVKAAVDLKRPTGKKAKKEKKNWGLSSIPYKPFWFLVQDYHFHFQLKPNCNISFIFFLSSTYMKTAHQSADKPTWCRTHTLAKYTRAPMCVHVLLHKTNGMWTCANQQRRQAFSF